MMPTDRWAVCPDPQKLDDEREPKFFQTQEAAEVFLNRRERLRGIYQEERKKALAQIANTPPPHLNFPQHLIPRRRKELGWQRAIPVVHVETKKTQSVVSFREFLKLEGVDKNPEQNWD